MLSFKNAYVEFFQQIGAHKTMVLSTALNDVVSSRMMSIIISAGKFYFQTDRTFKKYDQIQNNPKVSLCAENIQIEGICKELGAPAEHPNFYTAFKQYFPHSYEAYSMLRNERLFEVMPLSIQKWIYEDGKPFIETINFEDQTYHKYPYKGE